MKLFIVSSHGDHQTKVSFQSEGLKFVLLHNEESKHSHHDTSFDMDNDHHHSVPVQHEEDHVIMDSHDDLKTTASFLIDELEFVAVVFPNSHFSLLDTMQFYKVNEFNLSQLERPPNSLEILRTTVLRI